MTEEQMNEINKLMQTLSSQASDSLSDNDGHPPSEQQIDPHAFKFLEALSMFKH